jgi:hypothetical protein
MLGKNSARKSEKQQSLLSIKELAKNPYHGKELQSDLSGFWFLSF